MTRGVINRGMSRLIPPLSVPPYGGAFIGFLESMNEDKGGGSFPPALEAPGAQNPMSG